MPNLSKSSSSWLRDYTGIILLIAVLVNLTSGFANMTHSLTTPPMQETLSLNYTQIGILLTIASVVRMLSNLVFGTLAARYGSRIIVGVGVIGTGLSMVVLGSSQSFQMSLVAMAALGFTSGAALTPMMGLLSSWFNLNDRGTAAGLAAAGGSASFMIAGVLVPQLDAYNPDVGWRYSWYIFGIIIFCAGIICLAYLKDRPAKHGQLLAKGHPNPLKQSWPVEAFRSPLIWISAGMAFCAGWTHGIFSTYFGSYLAQEGISLMVAGQLLILIGALTIPSSILWGWLSDILDRGRAFQYSFFLQSIAFGFFWFWPVPISFLLGSALLGLTLRATYTICAASSSDYVPLKFSPAAFGIMSVGAGLGTSISPVIGGAIADATGELGWTFGIALFSTIVGTIGGYVLHVAKMHNTKNVEVCS